MITKIVVLNNNKELKGYSSAVVDHFIKLSYSSNKFRFFQNRNKQIIKDWIQTIINNIHLHDKWILYYHEDEIIAVGQLSLLNNNKAEVALSVADEYHFNGIGKKLIIDLIELAKQSDIKQILLSCLCLNMHMISILNSLNFTLKHEGSEMLGFLDI
jgi:GNAT superfamily N-acetyltransferase